MKNICALTKNEQRVIILILAAVLAFAAVKRYRQNLTNPPPQRSATPTAQSPSEFQSEGSPGTRP